MRLGFPEPTQTANTVLTGAPGTHKAGYENQNANGNLGANVSLSCRNLTRLQTKYSSLRATCFLNQRSQAQLSSGFSVSQFMGKVNSTGLS